MSYLDERELLQNQDTWKRTQLRFPPKLYEAVTAYAEKNSMSLNTAMISLLDKGLIYTDTPLESNLEEYVRQQLEEIRQNMEKMDKKLDEQWKDVEERKAKLANQKAP